jgi:hypothetical protein
MRKVYFTENQMKRLIGEDFESYLPQEVDASEVPDNSYGTEVSPSGKIDGEYTDNSWTDKVSKEIVPKGPYGRRYTYGGVVAGVCESVKKKLNETNQDLQNTQFNLTKNLKSDVTAMAAANGGDKLLNNMSKEIQSGNGFNVKSAYKRLYDLKNMAKNDPERFKRINGQRLISVISNQLENAKGASKRSKESKKAVGMQNVYQKAGGTKQSGNGMAHSQKPNSDVKFTYNS